MEIIDDDQIDPQPVSPVKENVFIKFFDDISAFSRAVFSDSARSGLEIRAIGLEFFVGDAFSV